MKLTHDILSLRNIIDRYSLLLLDVYGILVTAGGPCAEAVAFIEYLTRIDKPYLLLTNDASESPTATALRLNRCGMRIPAERIITSGSLLSSYFAQTGLRGSRCAVLGTAASRDYVAQAGARIVEITDDADIDVLAVCDDDGFPFLETVNMAITMVFRMLDQDRTLHLVLPNPDLIFPRGPGTFGITAGSIALLIEQAIEVRYPHRPPLRFVPLGKPYLPIYERALEVSGTRDMLMIGDQLATDILGARSFGIDSVLVTQGVTSPGALNDVSKTRPTYVLPSLALK